MVGGHFAGAVADHGIRDDPECRELLGQRDLNGEVGRLRELPFRPSANGSHRVRSSSTRDQFV